MPDEEERLVGGNVTDQVVRIGSTVRKPATLATPSVLALLTHLHHESFAGAPQAFGFDERGRQVLEFVPGRMWDRTQRHSQADLKRVGTLIRAFHDSVASFVPPVSSVWNGLSAPDGQDILCHNDLAPWNLVCGPDRWAFIDWDNAAPGTRLWDLAWATISFPPIEPACDLHTAAISIHAIVDGYRLEPSSYGLLLSLMAKRARAACDVLVQGAKDGQQPWAKLYDEGHHRYWGPVSEYIDHSALTLEYMLKSLCGGWPTSS